MSFKIPPTPVFFISVFLAFFLVFVAFRTAFRGALGFLDKTLCYSCPRMIAWPLPLLATQIDRELMGVFYSTLTGGTKDIQQLCAQCLNQMCTVEHFPESFALGGGFIAI